ncbi:MAG: hypothetical protein IPL46_21455 [Saprospiraceae bacterium]|nr:hypothetical protein [Saprospiraceae bacterium]
MKTSFGSASLIIIFVIAVCNVFHAQNVLSISPEPAEVPLDLLNQPTERFSRCMGMKLALPI